jgi:cadmium resistance protein CadD (predicted permease)
MGSLVSAIGTGIAAFATANINDIFLLTLFFSQVNHALRKRHIVTGQYITSVRVNIGQMLGYCPASQPGKV